MDKKYAISYSLLVFIAFFIPVLHAYDTPVLINSDSALIRLENRTYIIDSTDTNTRYHLSSEGTGTKIIEGNGARLVFSNAQRGGLRFLGFDNVVLKDIVVDWLEKPFSTVSIESINPANKSVTVSQFDISRLGKPESEMVSWGSLFHENGHRVIGGHYDVLRFRIADSTENNGTVTLSIPDSSVHFFNIFEVGQTITIVHRFTDRHALLFSSVENVTLENVEINTSPSMGVVVTGARSIDVNRLRVIPSSDNYASTNSDGLHIVDSGTRVKLGDSQFIGTQDDGVVISNRGVWSDVTRGEKGPSDTECRVISESNDQYVLSGKLGSMRTRRPEAYFCAEYLSRPKTISSSMFRDVRGIGLRIATDDVSIENNKFERITDQSIFIGGIFYGFYAPQSPATNVSIYENEFVTINLPWNKKDLNGVIESACKPYRWCRKRTLNSAITVFDNVFTGNGARAKTYVFD